MLDEDSRKVVDAYTAGVNAYIKDRKPSQLGLEFALLELQGIDITIEDWTVVDTMSWAEMMIFDQSDQMTTEMANIDRLAAVGWDMYRDLNPPYREDLPVILQSEEWKSSDKSGVFTAVYPKTADVQFLTGLFKSSSLLGKYPGYLAKSGFKQAAASNSFVVSGDLTADGAPLLANDPQHLLEIQDALSCRRASSLSQPRPVFHIPTHSCSEKFSRATSIRSRLHRW